MFIRRDSTCFWWVLPVEPFLLQHLVQIYNGMMNPVTKTYNMAGSVRKETVFFKIFVILKSSSQGKNFKTYLTVPP